MGVDVDLFMGVVDMNNNVLPIVYTIKGCDACVKLLTKWDSEGIEYEERRADLSQEGGGGEDGENAVLKSMGFSQEMMDEARKHGDVVPIVVYPNGSTEEGFEGGIGCYIG